MRCACMLDIDTDTHLAALAARHGQLVDGDGFSVGSLSWVTEAPSQARAIEYIALLLRG